MEKNEKFRMRRYSKKTATNIYAAHGRVNETDNLNKHKIERCHFYLMSSITSGSYGCGNADVDSLFFLQERITLNINMLTS